MTNLDDLKNKASEVIDDVKLKAKEAKLGAEKVADDLKHKAKETLLKTSAVHMVHITIFLRIIWRLSLIMAFSLKT